MAELRLTSMHKDFGTTQVVKGIDLQVRDREFVAFLGPSGCGKTTCLRIIAGLEQPTSGSVLIGGEDVTAKRPGERDVAMVFQNYALYPHMTVRENLLMGLRYRGVAANTWQGRVDEAARVLDLAALLDRKPGQLSGGQRQRVALGRAIVRRPKAFLMDEPLSNLDTALRARMRVELKLLHTSIDATTVYVTHDQIEAMTMADRIAVMHGGHLVQFGTPDEIFNEPANRFVAEFVGAPPMNMVAGEWATQEGGAAVRWAAGNWALRDEAAVPKGRQVLVGFRPHALVLGQAEGLIPMDACVEMSEPVGTHNHLHVLVAGERVTAAVAAGERPGRGEAVRLSVHPRDVYVFDSETGERIARGLQPIS